LIEGGPALAHVDADTRVAIGRPFFELLHGLGRDAGERWLAGPAEALGRRDGVDLPARFA
ncbi:MAG TPA: hypothetical protein VF457_02080, partial [Burkholderiaceae bacterium]